MAPVWGRETSDNCTWASHNWEQGTWWNRELYHITCALQLSTFKSLTSSFTAPWSIHLSFSFFPFLDNLSITLLLSRLFAFYYFFVEKFFKAKSFKKLSLTLSINSHNFLFLAWKPLLRYFPALYHNNVVFSPKKKQFLILLLQCRRDMLPLFVSKASAKKTLEHT